MHLKTLLVAGLGLCGLINFGNVEAAAPVQSPLRFRLSKQLLKRAVNVRDHEILKAFQGVEINADDENVDLGKYQKIVFSLSPPDGVDPKDWNLDFHTNKDYLGAETDQLKVSGRIFMPNGQQVPFSGPIPVAKLQYAIEKKFNERLQYEVFNYVEKDWLFKVGEVAGTGLSKTAGAVVGPAIENKMNDIKAKFVATGEVPITLKEPFPMDTLIPSAALYYAVQVANVVEETDKYINLELDLHKMGMVTDQQNSAMKKINVDFWNQTKDGIGAAAQLTIDENFFSQVFTVLTSVDQAFSLRKLADYKREFVQEYLDQMNRKMLAQVIPTFGEEFSEDSNIDVVLSLSHNEFLKGFPDSKRGGFQIDKKGNVKITVNAAMGINFEKDNGEWERARNIYMTFEYKFRAYVGWESYGTKFGFAPKTLEVTKMRILNKEGKEEENEQLMIMSVLSIQLEKLQDTWKGNVHESFRKNYLKKYRKELLCLGFGFDDIDINFKKGIALFSLYYKEKTPGVIFCEPFFEDLNKLNVNLDHQIDFEKDNLLIDFVQEGQKLAKGDSSAFMFGLGDHSQTPVTKKITQDASEGGVAHDEL